jgi:hypothetical protein
MTGCTRLSDRMPGVARGESAWTADEASHLADCSDCAAEWRLVRLAGQLGDSSTWTADLEALSEAVLARLRDTRTRQARTQRWRRSAMAIAAAAAVVVLIRGIGNSAARRLGDSAVQGPDGAATTDALLPGLDSLSEGALNMVLEGLGGSPLEDEMDLSPPDLESLDSTGLAMVLNRLEGT